MKYPTFKKQVQAHFSLRGNILMLQHFLKLLYHSFLNQMSFLIHFEPLISCLWQINSVGKYTYVQINYLQLLYPGKKYVTKITDIILNQHSVFLWYDYSGNVCISLYFLLWIWIDFLFFRFGSATWAPIFGYFVCSDQQDKFTRGGDSFHLFPM